MSLVRKILEATIPSGGSSATFTDNDIPNSLIRVYSTNSNIYPQNISLAGNTLTVTYEAVTSALGVAVELVKQGLEIDDNLTSENTDHALSAKQGKVLKGLIEGLDIPDNISELQDVNITDIEDGQVLAWDDTAEKFVNVDQKDPSLNIIDFSWVASSSSAMKTPLTETKTLSAGRYIVIVHTPYANPNVSGFQFMILVNNEYVYTTSILSNTSYNTLALYFDLNEASSVCLASATGLSVSWSAPDIHEGGMRVIKVGDI